MKRKATKKKKFTPIVIQRDFFSPYIGYLCFESTIQKWRTRLGDRKREKKKRNKVFGTQMTLWCDERISKCESNIWVSEWAERMERKWQALVCFIHLNFLRVIEMWKFAYAMYFLLLFFSFFSNRIHWLKEKDT